MHGLHFLSALGLLGYAQAALEVIPAATWTAVCPYLTTTRTAL